MKILILALIGLFGALSPVQATPPRYGVAYDTPLAVNQTHIYLLRVIEDNKGSYYIRDSHRFLIAQNLDTGAVDRFWLLDTSHEESVDLDHPMVKITRATPEIDLLAVLAGANAVPLSAYPKGIWRDGQMYPWQGAQLTQDGIQIGETLMPGLEIQAWISASLEPVFAAMPVDPSPYNTLEFDNVAYSKDLADCFVQELAANIPFRSLFRLDCENEGLGVLAFGIYLTIPDK